MVELKCLDAKARLLEAGVGDVWALISEGILTRAADVPEGYTDDGAPH